LPFWLEIAYSHPFWGSIPPNMVTHRFSHQNDHSCEETRRLSHKAWKSFQRFDLSVGSRKKVKTVIKKSQGGNISPIWEEAPTLPIEEKKFAWRITSPT